MRHFDDHLPLRHPVNRERAKELGLVWSKADRAYRYPDGSFPIGSEGDNSEGRWDDPMTPNDMVHAHR